MPVTEMEKARGGMRLEEKNSNFYNGRVRFRNSKR